MQTFGFDFLPKPQAALPLRKHQPQPPRSGRESIHEITLHALPVLPLRKADVVFLCQQSRHKSQFRKRQVFANAVKATCYLSVKVGGRRG